MPSLMIRGVSAELVARVRAYARSKGLALPAAVTRLLEAALPPPPETPTYDERRANVQPCYCGRLFTHPERCGEGKTCQALRHPHTKREEE